MLKYAVLILWRKNGVPANFYAFCISGLLHLVFSFSVFMFTSPPALELEFVLTAYKDKRLTLDLDQNQGLPPITHSFLFTITLDFKSLEFGYSRISSKISGGRLVIGEVVFREVNASAVGNFRIKISTSLKILGCANSLSSTLAIFLRLFAILSSAMAMTCAVSEIRF